MSGVHIIYDIHCDFSKIDESFSFDDSLSRIIAEAGATILNKYVHRFDSTGKAISINFTLAESHCCIHTWPESNYISFDVFTCGFSPEMTTAALRIASFFLMDLRKFDYRIINRTKLIRGLN